MAATKYFERRPSLGHHTGGKGRLRKLPDPLLHRHRGRDEGDLHLTSHVAALRTVDNNLIYEYRMDRYTDRYMDR